MIPAPGFRHRLFSLVFHVFCTKPRRLIALPLPYTYNARNFRPSATRLYLYFVFVVFTEKASGYIVYLKRVLIKFGWKYFYIHILSTISILLRDYKYNNTSCMFNIRFVYIKVSEQMFYLRYRSKN